MQLLYVSGTMEYLCQCASCFLHSETPTELRGILNTGIKLTK